MSAVARRRWKIFGWVVVAAGALCLLGPHPGYGIAGVIGGLALEIAVADDPDLP